MPPVLCKAPKSPGPHRRAISFLPRRPSAPTKTSSTISEEMLTTPNSQKEAHAAKVQVRPEAEHEVQEQEDEAHQVAEAETPRAKFRSWPGGSMTSPRRGR